MLSEQMLKTDVAFDASPEGASWQDSDLRAFLNGENNAGGEQTLLGTQFSPEEQNAIVVSQVDTEGLYRQCKPRRAGRHANRRLVVAENPRL